MRGRFGEFLVLLVGVLGLVGPSAASGAVRPQVLSQAGLSPQGVLLAESCDSTTACTAVGHSTSSGGVEVTLAAAAYGGVWRVESTPDPAGAERSALSGVSCTTASACAAVGDYTSSAGGQVTLAERWDGTSWSIQASPDPAGAQRSVLSGVSCAATTWCVAVGYYLDTAGVEVPLAERWDGKSWTVQTTPVPTGAGNSVLLGVSCSAAAACTAVGYYYSGSARVALAERWNGKSWTIEPTVGAPGYADTVFKGVSCTSATSCAAVGYTVNISVPAAGRQEPLEEVWDGTSWSFYYTPRSVGSGNNVFSGISCASTAVCTAVGYYYSGSTQAALVEQRTSTTGWTVQSTPSEPGAQRSVLSGVSCATYLLCAVVGSYTDSAGTEWTVAEGWSYSAWRIQPFPTPPSWSVVASPNGADPHGDLLAVSCTSATSCTAVGQGYDSAGKLVALAEGWNGTAWAIQSMPNPVRSELPSLSGVSCTSATACIAVGPSGTPLVDRWDGTNWSIEAAPSPADSQASYLQAVSCSSPSACTAVGYYYNGSSVQVPLVERWDGTSWTVQSTPSPTGAQSSSLSAVSCSSATACTAVGDYAPSTGPKVALAERWDGTSWTIEPTPSPTGAQGASLTGVSCSSATACMAVGSYTNAASTVVTLTEGWNGTSWTIEPTPNPAGAASSALTGVSCSSAIACAAVGGYHVGTSGTSNPLAERWDGTSWTIQPTHNPYGGAGGALQGVSCTAPTACITVGEYSNGAGQVTLAEDWNGAGWTIQPTPNPYAIRASKLVGVSCSTAAACTAVGSDSGAGGLAERWNGTSWTVQRTPYPGAAFTGVSCPTTSACTAVSGAGYASAERWNGTSWATQPVPNPVSGPGSLAGVSCPTVAMCVAVGSINGSATLAEAWDGTSWTIQQTRDPTGASSVLTGVSCSSATACTAVGYSTNSTGRNTLAERWDGTSWTVQTTPNPGDEGNTLEGVSCPTTTACTAVGYYNDSSDSLPVALAVEWNGSTWMTQYDGYAGVLSGVSCATATMCAAVGNTGLGTDTLAVAFGGNSWTSQPIPDPAYSTLLGVSCATAATCSAVGNYNNGVDTLVANYS